MKVTFCHELSQTKSIIDSKGVWCQANIFYHKLSLYWGTLFTGMKLNLTHEVKCIYRSAHMGLGVNTKYFHVFVLFNFLYFECLIWLDMNQKEWWEKGWMQQVYMLLLLKYSRNLHKLLLYNHHRDVLWENGDIY